MKKIQNIDANANTFDVTNPNTYASNPVQTNKAKLKTYNQIRDLQKQMKSGNDIYTIENEIKQIKTLPLVQSEPILLEQIEDTQDIINKFYDYIELKEQGADVTEKQEELKDMLSDLESDADDYESSSEISNDEAKPSKRAPEPEPEPLNPPKPFKKQTTPISKPITKQTKKAIKQAEKDLEQFAHVTSQPNPQKQIMAKVHRGEVITVRDFQNSLNVAPNDARLNEITSQFEENNKLLAQTMKPTVRNLIKQGSSQINIISQLKARGLNQRNAVNLYEQVSGKEYKNTLGDKLLPTEDTQEEVDIDLAPEFKGKTLQNGIPTMYFSHQNPHAVKYYNNDQQTVKALRLTTFNKQDFKHGDGVYLMRNHDTNQHMLVNIVFRNTGIHSEIAKKVDNDEMLSNDVDFTIEDKISLSKQMGLIPKK